MNLFDFYIPEWFFVALSFVVLVSVGGKLFWRPVLKILSDRQNMVASEVARADKAKAEVSDAEKRVNELNAKIEAETIEQMRESRTRAGKEFDRIVAEGNEKAEKIVEAARKQAQVDSVLMRETVQSEVFQAALAAAAQYLSKNLTGEDNEHLIDDFISKEIAV